MTEYIILRKVPEAHLEIADLDKWEEVEGTFPASSGRRALASANLGEGEYVPVPVRSWRPLKVKVEQTTKVTIS